MAELDSWSHDARDYDVDITMGAPVGQSEASGKLENIVNMFQDRYDKLHKIMRRQCGFVETANIRHIRTRQNSQTLRQATISKVTRIKHEVAIWTHRTRQRADQWIVCANVCT